MSAFDTYAHCPGCDARFYAPHGDPFHLSIHACPHCGEPNGSRIAAPHGSRVWPVRIERYVSTGIWWKPWTWGGHWESRP